MYYRDHGSFPENKEKLGRALGPTTNKGNQMAQAVLAASGRVIPCHTLRKLTIAELHSETEKRKCAIFDDIILKKLGDSVRKPEKPIPGNFVPCADEVNPDPVNVIAENTHAQVDSEGY